MKRLITAVSAVLSAAVLIALAACSNNVQTSPSLPAADAPSPSPSPSVSSARPSPTPKPSPSPSPEVTYTVKTDYSQLTPYEPMEEIYTRLSEDYMPELVPSDDYGMLLPYVGQTFQNGIFTGFDLSYKGLMTADGVMVTDDVYSEAYQANWFDDTAGSYHLKPLYVLAQYPYIPEDKSEWFGGSFVMHAVCATDGSWVTPFEYTDIACFDEAVFCVRDAETNDIDVMDYSGRLLYNVKDVPAAKKLQPRFYHQYDIPVYSEGYIILESAGSFFNVRTGKYIDTGFDSVRWFSESLAAVMKDGLWGYVDKSFNFIIAPQYAYGSPFKNGKACVDFGNGRTALIDKTGNTILTVDGYLSNCYGGDGYFYYRKDNTLVLLDSDGKELMVTDDQDALFTSGGFCVRTDDQTLLFYAGKKYEFPKNQIVTSVLEGYIICRFTDRNNMALMTLDGKLLGDAGQCDMMRSIVTTPSGQTYLLLGSSDYEHPAFGIYTVGGALLFSGVGSADYNALTALFCIRDESFFGYADETGRFVFRHSLLDNLPD